MRKFSSVLMIILTVSALPMIGHVAATDYPVFADTSHVAKPSPPEFTITLADHSYDVPPTTTSTTNPYNNKTATTTIPSYHVKNITIDLTVKNQPCPSNIEGNKSYLLYFVRTKGHYAQDYSENYLTTPDAVQSSSSGYTVISFPAECYSVGDEVDFQVKAILAYECTYTRAGIPPMTVTTMVHAAVGNWSFTQTFKVPDASTLSENSANPALTLQVPEFIALTVLSLSIVLSVLFILKLRRTK